MCSITAAGLAAVAYPVDFSLGSFAALWVFVVLTLIVGIIAFGITAFEPLAGYRGSPQTIGLILASLSCLAPVLFLAWLRAAAAS